MELVRVTAEPVPGGAWALGAALWSRKEEGGGEKWGETSIYGVITCGSG